VAVTAALFIPGTAGASPGGGQGPPGSRAPGWLAAKQQALAGFQAPPPAQVTLTPATPGPSWTAEKVRAVVMVGPGRATACTVVGELLVPDGAAAAHSQPAVMDTNGFGGSWTSSTALPLAQMAATDGYVALTYSGLGFGGSGCQIELDSPTWDGAAASQLVSWLGTLPEVSKDGADDPRVGMVGGSYGGGVQFSAAAVDPRIDAIVPVITWNDLAYSLAPDNLAFTGPTRPTTEPGVLKWEWASLFFGDGMATPLEHPTAPYSAGDCPDFDPAVCQAYVTTVALGYPDRATVTLLRHDSMVDFWSRLHLPVLLAQGEDDSLFTIQEAVDNYRELSAAGDPVQLVLQSWGHSGSTPAPGELSYAAPYSGYENALIADFFARWLRGQSVSTGAPVQYFRPWVPYQGTAAPAYGTASGWPVAPGTDLYLSGGGPGAAGALVASAGAVVPGSQTFVNPPGGIGTSYSETSAVQGTAPFSTVPPTDAPGTFASWTSAPLTATTDVVGIPTLSVSLSASVPAGVTPSTDPVVVAKLYGVAPTGALTLVDRLVAPVRLASTGGRVTITLPGIVHRYGAGDRLELVLAAGDDAYLGNRTADAYTVAVSAADPPVLSLPVVRGTQEQAGGPPPAGA
jgi:ABC-2 type transport system ATP-binding protein